MKLNKLFVPRGMKSEEVPFYRDGRDHVFLDMDLYRKVKFESAKPYTWFRSFLYFAVEEFFNKYKKKVLLYDDRGIITIIVEKGCRETTPRFLAFLRRIARNYAFFLGEGVSNEIELQVKANLQFYKAMSFKYLRRLTPEDLNPQELIS